MPLKIRPNAIEQDQGDFIFPGVISLVGQTEFSFDADGVTGSALVSARDTSSGFKTPVTIRGSAIHLVGNEDLVALRIEEGGGQGWLKLNPTAKDYDLSYLADDGTVLLYGDAGNGYVGIGTDSPQRRFVVADTNVNIGMKSLGGRGWSLYAPGGGLEEFTIWAHHDAEWTTGEYKLRIYPSGTTLWNPSQLDRDFEVRSASGQLLYADASTHRIAIGTNAPNRLLEVSNPSGEAYIRIDGNSGSAVMLEYERDGVATEIGLTAGGDFHLWSDESAPFVVALGGTQEFRINPNLGPLLGDDRYLQFGQFTTGSAAWPAEPSVGDWLIFGQTQSRSGLTPYVRHNGASAWGYPQPIISRDLGDYKVTDTAHLIGPAYYVAGQRTALAPTTGAPVVDEYMCIPFTVNQRFVVTRIGFNVTVAGSAGSVARVGIYDNYAQYDSRPDRLILDGGEKTTTTTGIKETTGLSVELIPGELYWAIYVCGTAAPTIKCLAASAIFPIFGFTGINSAAMNIGAQVNENYGALKADISSSGGGSYSSTNPIPAIYMSFD